MDIIGIGTFSKEDNEIINTLIKACDMEFIQDYETVKIECEEGLSILKTKLNVPYLGIVVKRENGESISSYPLIYQITEDFLENSKTSDFFTFIDSLKESTIQNLILSFADEWDNKTLVRIEKCKFNSLKKRLNNLFVWCESYVDLVNNEDVRMDNHPLILKLER